MIKKKNITYISEEIQEPKAQIKKSKDKFKQCQKEKEEYLIQMQRIRADFINYRNRQEKVLEEIKKYSQYGFIIDLLVVLDSLTIGAEKNEGIKQIKGQFESILKKYGLEEIKADGKFNPEIHEAIEIIKSKKESGNIIQEVQKGYKLGDKVLRPSKVKVSN
ncbi:MAG: nucleotide exchange factor GrpE [bacterium]